MADTTSVLKGADEVRHAPTIPLLANWADNVAADESFTELFEHPQFGRAPDKIAVQNKYLMLNQLIQLPCLLRLD